MKKLLDYLNSLPKDARASLCLACGTTEGYLRKAVSKGQNLGADLCIALERETGAVVQCEDLRADIDWAYIRSTAPNPPPHLQFAGKASTLPP